MMTDQDFYTCTDVMEWLAHGNTAYHVEEETYLRMNQDGRLVDRNGNKYPPTSEPSSWMKSAPGREEENPFQATEVARVPEPEVRTIEAVSGNETILAVTLRRGGGVLTLQWNAFPEAWRGEGVLHADDRGDKEITVRSQKRPRLVYKREQETILIAAPGTRRSADTDFGVCQYYAIEEVLEPVTEVLSDVAGKAEWTFGVKQG